MLINCFLDTDLWPEKTRRICSQIENNTGNYLPEFVHSQKSKRTSCFDWKSGNTHAESTSDQEKKYVSKPGWENGGITKIIRRRLDRRGGTKLHTHTHTYTHLHTLAKKPQKHNF